MNYTALTVDRHSRPSSLADALDVILDKGVVIDAYVNVAVLGIELLTIDARIVVASLDTYLRFAEIVDRVHLQPQKQVGGLPGMMEEATQGAAKQKTKGALQGAKETAQDVISSFRSERDDEDEDRDERAGPEPQPQESGEARAVPLSRQRPARGGQ